MKHIYSISDASISLGCSYARGLYYSHKLRTWFLTEKGIVMKEFDAADQLRAINAYYGKIEL
jgi:hypothetical protein